MRALIWLAMVVIMTAIVAGLICRWIGPAAHVRQMLIAAAIALLAGIAALLPVLLGRGLPKALNAQAGLVATVLHLFVCLAGGAAAAMLGGATNPSVVLLWMLPFYWITLSALIVIVVRAIRAAPTDAGPNDREPTVSDPADDVTMAATHQTSS